MTARRSPEEIAEKMEIRARRAIDHVTALAWVFPPEDEDGLWHVLSRYFVPEEHLRKRATPDAAGVRRGVYQAHPQIVAQAYPGIGG